MSAPAFTPSQLGWMTDRLAEEFPHLSVSVELRDGTLYVDALPRSA